MHKKFKFEAANRYAANKIMERARWYEKTTLSNVFFTTLFELSSDGKLRYYSCRSNFDASAYPLTSYNYAWYYIGGLHE